MKPLRALYVLWGRRGEMREWGLVARGAGHSLVLQGVGLGLGYLVHVLFARWLGATDYGVYTYVLAWTSLLAILAAMGVPMLAVRFVPEYRVGGRWALLRGLLRWSGTRVLTVGVGLALAGAALVLWLDPDASGGYARPMLAGFSLVPLQALLSVTGGMYRGFHRIGRAYVSPVLRHALALSLAGVLWGAGTALTSLHAVGVVVAAALAVLVVQAVGLWRGVPVPARQARPAYASGRWLRVSIPLLLVGGFVMVLYETDVLMVGSVLGPREVGLYRAASRTAGLASLVPVAVGAAADPMLARLYAEGARARLQRLASVAVRWATGGALAAAMLFVVFGRPVLALFGGAFTEAYGVLVVLAVGQAWYAGVGLAAGLLNLTGHQKTGMVIFGGSALLNVGLNAVGLLVAGSLGAAVATATSFGVLSLALWRMARHKVGIDASIVYALRRPPGRVRS